MAHDGVVIIGGGIAGLCCAKRLQQENIPFLILEGAEAVGGRIRTDRVEGFLLDRGFQVLLSSYPEARNILDFPSLDLRTFYPGALVRVGNRFHKVADPWREPLEAARQLFSPVGSLMDKLHMARLRWKLNNRSFEYLLAGEETTTLAALRAHGFSAAMIDQFFKPFFGGVFLEPDLQTSSRLFEYLFKLFASGHAVLPAQGMERIPSLLASTLPADSIRLGAKAARLESSGLILETGERLSAKSIVIATEGPQAARFLSEIPRPSSRSVSCLYYAAEESPLNEPILALNGTGDGPINHCCVPSQVAPDYAPPGAALLSVTVLGKIRQYYEPLEETVRAQLADWFGPQAFGWKHLKTYHILNAVPALEPPTPSGLTRPSRISRGLYVCGDYLDTASINGAMVSGRRAAEAVIEDLK